MPKLPHLLLVLAVCTPFACAAEESANLKYFRDIAETRSYSLGRPVAPKLTPDGQTVIYLRGGPRDPVLRLYEFPLPAGPERELLTPAQLLGNAEEKLTAEEKARRERARVTLRGFTRFDLSKDGTRLLVTLSGQLYVVNRANLKVTALPGKNWIDPRFSPDGTAVAAVSAGELHVIELGVTPSSHAVTTGATATLSHATAEFVAQEEMARREGYWWAPDSQSLVYQETDESAVEVRHIADPLHPDAAPVDFFYPRSGSPNATVRLGLVARSGGATRWMKWDAAKFPYLTRVVWRETGDPLCLSVMDRAQQTSLLLRADPATGATTELLRETDPAWLNLDASAVLPRWLPGSREFLWTTESRGAWQVELRAADGKLLRPLTPLDFIYKGLSKLDAAHGSIYVSGGSDPREAHVWRFPLAGGTGTALTTAPGQHSASFSENASTFIYTYNLLDGTAGAEVRSADGQRLATLPSVAEKFPARPNVELTQTTGTPSFYAALIRPRAFQSGKKYPVILAVYAGPTTTTVSASTRGYLSNQWMADQGYIVVRLDGRGTPHRGRDWERIVRGNLIDVALEDQIAGLRALGVKYPELDLTRVGVTGWSFGGYFSAMATIRRPDVFRCGVAGAPVITWENYDTFYTERYLGLPQTDAAAYQVSSVLTYANQLTRPLLLIHGLTDDNVYAQHTLQLADALFMAGKPYEFMPMLGTHLAGSSDPVVQLRQQMRVIEFFNRELKP
ncbi:MAG: S9 family peptidase [Opitutus sp.]|nr:S9 family peptidase [Opitutus sp.]